MMHLIIKGYYDYKHYSIKTAPAITTLFALKLYKINYCLLSFEHSLTINIKLTISLFKMLRLLLYKLSL